MDADRATGGAGRGVLLRPFPYARPLSERPQPPADAVVAAGCAPGGHGKCRRRNGHSRATPDGPLPTAQEEPVLAGDRTAGPTAMPRPSAHPPEPPPPPPKEPRLPGVRPPPRQVHGRPGKSVIPPPPWLLRAASGRA